MTSFVTHLRTHFQSLWPEPPIPVAAEWQKLAGIAVDEGGLKQVNISPDRSFQAIKLRSFAADLDVRRWVMEFHDGSILDVSVNLLLEGTESKPVAIAGRRLKTVVVKYDPTGVARRGRLEIWGEP
jgi:hypothetical protein